MAQRIGFATLEDLARRMCKAVVKFSPLIRSSFPNSPELLLALETALTACSLLDEEIAKVKEIGD